MDNQLIRIKDTVMARIDPGRDVPEEEIRQIIDNVLRDYSSEYMLPAKKKLEYRKILFNAWTYYRKLLMTTALRRLWSMAGIRFLSNRMA